MSKQTGPTNQDIANAKKNLRTTNDILTLRVENMLLEMKTYKVGQKYKRFTKRRNAPKRFKFITKLWKKFTRIFKEKQKSEEVKPVMRVIK